MTEPYEQRTADLVTLERLELTTRDHPARDLFGPLLKAQIERTRRLGTQPIDPAADVEPGEEWRAPGHYERDDIAETTPPLTIPEDAGPPDWDEDAATT